MDTTLNCAECGRVAREDENADDEWRAGSDGVGELHVFCREYWEREFGEDEDLPPGTPLESEVWLGEDALIGSLKRHRS